MRIIDFLKRIIRRIFVIIEIQIYFDKIFELIFYLRLMKKGMKFLKIT